MKSYEAMAALLEYMPAEKLLEELVQAMSNQEGKENFQHIADMHGIELEFNDD